MFVVVLLLVVSNILVQCNTDLKVEYYEKLITKGIQDAASYQPRKDNSDFFRNGNFSETHDYGQFDFIIVGAGSSGSVVASRLSEIQRWKILLLEAGGEEDDLSQIPGMHTLMPSSDKNWGYTTTPQSKGCSGMVDKKCPYARGKVLGGSGAINGLVNIRGHEEDYNKWERLGNPGWSFKDVLPYFKKSENSQIEDGDDKYHGFAGPLNNAYSTPDSPFQKVFADAHVELGYKEIDYNGANQIGVGKFQTNILNGKRVSGGNSYIEPSRNRKNFNVTTNALVIKILLDRESNGAYGVEFVRNSRKYRAISRKETIICGGSINSPQLLMLSGIGPEQELRKHNIKIFKNLPVGQYMRDHIAFTHIYFRTNYTEKTIALKKMIKDYLIGRGILTTSFNSKSVSFVNLKNSSSGLPDVEIVIVPPTGKEGDIQSPRNYNNSITPSLNSLKIKTDFILSAILLHPRSTGKITLKSNSSLDFPNIDIRLFAFEEDIEDLYQSIRFAINLTDTKAFRKYNAKLFLPLKICEEFTFNTKDFWYCAIRHLAFNSYHMSSTAKMGPADDPLAVVNNELKVHEVNNLRIVDCSIMPDTISGHTNAVAFMIGEKAADMIKKEHGVLYKPNILLKKG